MGLVDGRFLAVGFVSAAGVLAGCGEASDAGSDAEPLDAAAAFSALEERLVSATSVQIDFDISAEGAVEVGLQGKLHIRPDGTTSLTAAGLFAGQEVDLFLSSDGQHFEFGNGPDRSSNAVPGHLNEALLIGLTRMGLLHNLAMLSGNAPPDKAGGGVRAWVVVEDHSFGEAEAAGERSQVVSFSIIVAETPSGSASLEIDPNGQPVLRKQTVRFPDGEMRVVERYTGVRISP